MKPFHSKSFISGFGLLLSLALVSLVSGCHDNDSSGHSPGPSASSHVEPNDDAPSRPVTELKTLDELNLEKYAPLSGDVPLNWLKEDSGKYFLVIKKNIAMSATDYDVFFSNGQVTARFDNDQAAENYRIDFNLKHLETYCMFKMILNPDRTELAPGAVPIEASSFFAFDGRLYGTDENRLVEGIMCFRADGKGPVTVSDFREAVGDLMDLYGPKPEVKSTGRIQAERPGIVPAAPARPKKSITQKRSIAPAVGPLVCGNAFMDELPAQVKLVQTQPLVLKPAQNFVFYYHSENFDLVQLGQASFALSISSKIYSGFYSKSILESHPLLVSNQPLMAQSREYAWLDLSDSSQKWNSIIIDSVYGDPLTLATIKRVLAPYFDLQIRFKPLSECKRPKEE